MTNTGYADVNDLRMYYELHGPASAPPLVLLHGAYMSTGMFGPLLPGLAAHRRVLVPDLQALEFIATVTPETLAGSPLETGYTEIAPDPGHFPVLVEKLTKLDLTPFVWPEVAAIPAPTLLVFGDGDCVRPEHAVEMLRLLGGGTMGDMTGPSRNRLAICPARTTPCRRVTGCSTGTSGCCR